MYPALFLVPLFDALKFAGIAFAPGVLLLAVTCTLRALARRHSGGPEDAGPWLRAVHFIARRASIMLLAASSGFLGAGLFGVSFHVALLVVAVIWDSVSPGMDVDPDMSHLQLIYYGALGLGFLVFFAIGMSKLVKWVKIGQRLA